MAWGINAMPFSFYTNCWNFPSVGRGWMRYARAPSGGRAGAILLSGMNRAHNGGLVGERGVVYTRPTGERRQWVT